MAQIAVRVDSYSSVGIANMFHQKVPILELLVAEMTEHV